MFRLSQSGRWQISQPMVVTVVITTLTYSLLLFLGLFMHGHHWLIELRLVLWEHQTCNIFATDEIHCVSGGLRNIPHRPSQATATDSSPANPDRWPTVTTACPNHTITTATSISLLTPSIIFRPHCTPCTLAHHASRPLPRPSPAPRIRRAHLQTPLLPDRRHRAPPQHGLLRRPQRAPSGSVLRGRAGSVSGAGPPSSAHES